MNDLSKDLLIKIQNLYKQKKYSKLETIVEKLKNLNNLPSSLQMTYAVSKALNPKGFELAALIISLIFNFVLVANNFSSLTNARFILLKVFSKIFVNSAASIHVIKTTFFTILEYNFFVITIQSYVAPLSNLGIFEILYFLLLGSSLSGEYPKKKFYSKCTKRWVFAKTPI